MSTTTRARCRSLDASVRVLARACDDFKVNRPAAVDRDMNARARRATLLDARAERTRRRARDDSGRLFDSSRARTIVDAPA
jgi:hypothetical protein